MLLPSHLEICRDVFCEMDRHGDEILKRTDFVMHLRTDPRVVEFVDADAVKVGKGKVLTFDNVLGEVEKDEMYENMHRSKNEASINHKEFLTWNEFVTYFEDYRDIEERNRKAQQMATARESLMQGETVADDA